ESRIGGGGSVKAGGRGTACPLASDPTVRAGVATRTRVADSRASFGLVIHTWASRRGRTRREETIMTRNKAQKTAIRQRMAVTGEPYSVARRAAGAGDAEPEDLDRDELTPEERYAQEAEPPGRTAEEGEAQPGAFPPRD